MKKFKLLVAPFLVVPFLASCGGGNTPSVDIHVVSEQEFKDACSFSGVQYVQANLNNVGESITLLQELSPTVYHSVNESSSFYNETFVKKENSTYEMAIREVKGGTYTFNGASASDFLTPQSEQFKITTKLEHAGLSYSSFTYDAKAGTYSATSTSEGGAKTTTTLKFENKKLISDQDKMEEGDTITTYAYESKTPEYPEKPPVDPYIVNEDEFNAAIAFTGDEYLQTEGTVEVGNITTLEECSPNIYHYIGRMHSEQSVNDSYDEFYVYKIDENTYKRIYRSDESTPWEGISWQEAAKTEWCNPQKIGANMIQAIGTIEFDPSKYDENTHSYTLKNTTEQEFIFKFENKKLILINFAGSNEMTFDYEEVTPVLPIPAPTPTI